MTNAQYRAQQLRLMRKMQDTCLSVFFGCEVPVPSIKLLRSRNLAAARLALLVYQLHDSIGNQLQDTLEAKACNS